MSIKSLAKRLKLAKPYLAVILLQFGIAGLSIIVKFALNQGMSQYVLVVYRHAIATAVIAPLALVLERKTRPKMTTSVFTKVVILGLLEPVIDQNLFYTGMKSTTATFAAAMTNVIPAFVFIMAWTIRLEKVNIRRIHSQAKVLGTIVTVGGAMLMTLVHGPVLNLPWAKQESHIHSTKGANNQVSVKGALMIAAGCSSWSSFVVLQAITLKAYPAELSLTALICLMGAAQGTAVALVLEWGNPAAWSIHLDSKLYAALHGGIVCSGFAYYIQGVVMKDKGPVFVTAFSPLCMVIVAIMSSFILSETMRMGRVISAVIIVAGLYMVLWGKSKDEMLASESFGMEALASANGHTITEMNENVTSISNRELVAVAVDRTTNGGRNTDESV